MCIVINNLYFNGRKINMNDMIKLKRWAILGATNDESKFSYKIFKSMEKGGYMVYPVNPKYNLIDGIKVFNSIEELPKIVDGIIMVVSPKVSLISLDKIKEKGIKNVWFQPGSFNEEVINKAQQLEFNIENKLCIYKQLEGLI